MQGTKSTNFNNPNCRDYIKRMNGLWKKTVQTRRSALAPGELNRSHEKFDRQSGNVIPHYGLTVVAPVSLDSLLYSSLLTARSAVKEQFEELGFNERASFLPTETLHMTIAGLAHQKDVDLPENKRDEIIERVQSVFYRFSQERTSPLQFMVGGLALHGRVVLVARAYPASDQDFLGLESLRAPIRQSINKKVKPFIGHISLAYLVKTFSPTEFDAVVNVLEVYADKVFGNLRIEEIELRHFSSMADYGKEPISSLHLG